jgi:hypothetical protein
MSDRLLACLILFSVRIIPFICLFNVSERLKQAALAAVNVLCVLMIDSWYRGWYAANSSVLQYLIDNSWSKESWPPSNIDYIQRFGMFCSHRMNVNIS